MVDRRPAPTILTFTAKLVSSIKDDGLRDFVVAFFVEDSSFMITERVVRNSGFRGGKFLNRTKIDNPATKAPYTPEEVTVGSTIFIGGWWFDLTGASEEALKTMEANPDRFTRSDLSALMRPLIADLKPKGKDLRSALLALDKKKHGKLPSADVRDVLADFGVTFETQEWLTLQRRFQFATTDLFLYEDFLALLS
jgi:hypothetical protein